MGAAAAGVAALFVDPLRDCCKYVLNDMEIESNCGCQESPCGCKVVTHQVDVESVEEEIT